jgi:hypothetical protein
MTVYKMIRKRFVNILNMAITKRSSVYLIKQTPAQLLKLKEPEMINRVSPVTMNTPKPQSQRFKGSHRPMSPIVRPFPSMPMMVPPYMVRPPLVKLPPPTMMYQKASANANGMYG